MKATVILDLYQGFYQGKRLRPGDRITQKKVLAASDFASLDELARTLLAFVDRYNQGARPFNWNFTAADLTRLLGRISAHEHAAREPAEPPQAA